MKCTNCGTELTEGASNCSACGFPVSRFSYPTDKNVEDMKIDIQPIAKHPEEDKVTIDSKNEPGKGIITKALVCMMIPVVIVCIIANIMASTVKDNEESGNNSGSELSSTSDEKRVPKDYTPDIVATNGNKLDIVGGVIYNDNGGSISGMYEEDSRARQFYMNESQTAGVLVDDSKKCLYINSNLEIRTIADQARGGGLSFSGDYAYYTVFGSGIYLYDIENGTTTHIEGSDKSYAVTMSPNGKYVGFEAYGTDLNTVLKIGGVDTETFEFAQGPGYVLSISDDGRFIIYRDENNNTLAWNDDNVIKLNDNYIYGAVFNRDCTQVLYETDNAVYLLTKDMDSPKKLMDAQFADEYIDAHCREIGEYSLGYKIYSIDDFAGTIIEANHDIYFLTEDLEPVLIHEKCITSREIRHRENDYIFVFYEMGGTLSSYVCTLDGKVTYNHIVEDISYNCFEVNDDGTIMWYYDTNERTVYQVDIDSGERKVIYEGEILTHGQLALKYDSFTNECFFIGQNGECMGFSPDGSHKTYATDGADPSFIHYDEYVKYVDKKGGKHVLVFGMFALVEGD